MEKVLEEAEKNLLGLKSIVLGVMANNPIALNLYKEFGFIEYGTLPEAFFYKGEYIAEIRMCKKIK